MDIVDLEDLYERGGRREALKGLKALADSGDSDAMLAYAGWLDDYADLSVSYGGEIIKYFEMAAEEGEIDAFFHLGSMYHGGEYVETDLVKAKKYYKLGSEQGDLDCMEGLADLILEETNPDYDEVFNLYLSAINGGASCYEKCMTTIIKGGISGDLVREFKKKSLAKFRRPFILALCTLACVVIIVIFLFYIFTL